MARVILLTDFGEEYAKDILAGIVEYSRETEPWIVCKIPLSYRDLHSIEGVIAWALRWKADAIIGQFYNTDKVELFEKAGIIAIAQDFKQRFSIIPNITGNHKLAGQLGAQHFIPKGFVNYAFFGIKEAVWSSERGEGFKQYLKKSKIEYNFFEYSKTNDEELWYYDEKLKNWILELPKPIAIMACDDNQAHHIAEICSMQNIAIPDQISILGVDNDESICLLSNPPISSLNQATKRGGYDAAALIDVLIKDPKHKPSDIIVQPTYITRRASTDIFSTNNVHISTVLKHIHQEVNNKLHIDNLVKLVPLSRRSLEVLFKEVTGKSIYGYILNLRVEKFASELIETNKPIINIALDLGYVDYKNLSRQFKNIKDCTPSEYREKHKNSLAQYEDTNTQIDT